MQLEYERNGKDYGHDVSVQTEESGVIVVEGVSQKTLEYLLQYGWAQSLQDSIAGREKKVRDEYAAKIANGETFEADEIDAAVAAEIDGLLMKRADGILSGTLRERGVGEQRDPLRSVATEMVKAALKAMGKKVTKEKMAELVNGMLSDDTKRAKVQAELDRRRAEAAGFDIELDV